MRAFTLRNPVCGCVFSRFATLACGISLRRRSRLALTVTLALASVMGAITITPFPAWAAETVPDRLALNDVADLAVATQPLLDAQRSAVGGARYGGSKAPGHRVAGADAHGAPGCRPGVTGCMEGSTGLGSWPFSDVELRCGIAWLRPDYFSPLAAVTGDFIGGVRHD